MKRISLIPIVMLSVATLALSQKALDNNKVASHLFAGTWKANVAKSQRDPNHQFESLRLRFEFLEDVVLLTYTGVNAAGKEEGGTRKLYPDGKDHAVAGADGFVEVTRWLGPRLLESVGMKDGKVVGQSTYEVSSNGKILTAKVKSIDARGRRFEQAIIFDRE